MSKGRRKGKKSKRSSNKKAVERAFRAAGGGGGGKRGRSNQRPLAFLKQMAFKMRKNLPKLEALIERRSKGGE
jgi:hypothetical protein